ncbi:pentapeptide repeat-containing protein [Streptomyces sp. NPDC060064]|uniref:pentapeptide repeat-containing protein n=1 Tax=Streptomyces sp. NPDC060064 TaxID=3347049 RepID=UPI0036A73196
MTVATLLYSNAQVRDELKVNRDMLKVSRDELRVSQEGQITDRYTAAVENLGNEAMDVRLGGVYALQRIMQDSRRDQPTIANVLASYVRAHAIRPPSESSREVPADALAALKVLVNRNPRLDGDFTLDLRQTHLAGVDLNTSLLGKPGRCANLELVNFRGADLTSADLTGVLMHEATLQGTNLSKANMRGADLTEATLIGTKLKDARLFDADLTGVFISGATLANADLGLAALRSARVFAVDLTHARLRGADLRGTSFHLSDLRGANLESANLMGANLMTARVAKAQVLSAVINSKTLLPQVLFRDRDVQRRIADVEALIRKDPDHFSKEAPTPFICSSPAGGSVR